jgi:heme-binding protein
MNASDTAVRRVLFGVFAGGLLAFGSAAIMAPALVADQAHAPAVVSPAQGAAR